MWKEDQLPQLIGRCMEGEPRAQRSLYQMCYPYGITVALHYSSSREEAEEVLHDAFLKVFRHLREGKSPREIKPWFRRVVINTAIDYYRKRQSGWKIFNLPAPTAHNDAIESLNQEDLYRLLQALPPAYRMAFNLHVLEGYTHAEIARRLSVSVGTSKSNLSKARKQLQRLAGSYFFIDNKLSNA